MLGVEEAKHIVFLNGQGAARSHRRRGRDPQLLASQAGFAQKIARPENGNDRLLACGGAYADPYAAGLNVEDILSCFALGEESLPLAEFDPSLGHTAGIEKGQYLGGE